MIDYEDFEPTLIALLAPLSAEGVAVRGMPNEPKKQGVPDTGGAMVTMGWFAATASDAGPSDGQHQAMVNRLVLEVRTPTLRGPLGQYQLPGRVVAILKGRRVPGLGQLRFRGWELIEREDGANGRFYSGVVSFAVESMA